jgi:hypothetical protein
MARIVSSSGFPESSRTATEVSTAATSRLARRSAASRSLGYAAAYHPSASLETCYRSKSCKTQWLNPAEWKMLRLWLTGRAVTTMPIRGYRTARAVI